MMKKKRKENHPTIKVRRHMYTLHYINFAANVTSSLLCFYNSTIAVLFS